MVTLGSGTPSSTEIAQILYAPPLSSSIGQNLTFILSLSKYLSHSQCRTVAGCTRLARQAGGIQAATDPAAIRSVRPSQIGRS